MTEKLHFSHSISQPRGYTTLTLTLRLEEKDTYAAQRSDSHRTVSLCWQMTNDDPIEEREWYAFSVKVDTDTLENFQHCNRIVRKLKGKDALKLGFRIQPSAVLERLRALRAIETVYDSRLGEHVPIQDALPADYSAWRDDYDALGKSSCTAGCLARNEREARSLILAEFTRLVNDSYNPDVYANLLTEFVTRGQPVIKLREYGIGSWRAPDVTPFEDRIKLASAA